MGLTNIGATLDQSPLDDTRVARFAAGLEIPGWDRHNYWLSPPTAAPPQVGLFQSCIWTSSEDRVAEPLETDPFGSAVVVADARIDNRRELLVALREELREGDRASDAAVILAAFRKWGRQCPKYLRGDFAFIIWSPADRLLFAARDIFGIRSLLYHRSGSRTVLASTVGAILTALDHVPDLNRNFLTNFLDGRTSGASETAHEGILRLPPAHHLTIHRGQLALECYDELRPVSAPRTEADAHEQFRALFESAVEARLRSHTAAGVVISGGFDSSSILCTADQAIEAGRSSVSLRSYSAVFDQPPMSIDRPFLDAVLRKCAHVAPTLVPSDSRSWTVDSCGSTDGYPLDEPAFGGRFLLMPLVQQAVRDGCRVLLYGRWADQLLLRAPYLHGRLAWNLPPRAWAREWPHFFRESPAGFVRGLAHELRRGVHRVSAMTLRKNRVESVMADLLRDRITTGRYAAVVNESDQMSRFVGAELRFPFLDRNLYEFVMGLPPHFLFRDREVKRLLRQPLAAVLPPEFQQRTSFAHIGPLVTGGMRRDAPNIVNLLRNSHAVEMQLISPERVSKILAPLQEQAVGVFDFRAVQQLVSLELWLRRRSTHTLSASVHTCR
jgi:asparagine synthase (glutamine-hydrolysing)